MSTFASHFRGEMEASSGNMETVPYCCKASHLVVLHVERELVRRAASPCQSVDVGCARLLWPRAAILQVDDASFQLRESFEKRLLLRGLASRTRHAARLCSHPARMDEIGRAHV